MGLDGGWKEGICKGEVMEVCLFLEGIYFYFLTN